MGIHLFKRSRIRWDGDYSIFDKYHVGFFKHGSLYAVYPSTRESSLYDDRGTAYDARYIVSDYFVYDLYDADSVASIPIPQFNKATDSIGVTGSLDYLLRMCAGHIRDKFSHEQSIVILQKAVELMQRSGIGWQLKDYKRFVLWLYEDGRFEEAEYWEHRFTAQFDNARPANLIAEINRKFGGAMNDTDYIAFLSDSPACCDQCAIYSGRIYCISGRDKKFPSVPAILNNELWKHTSCLSSVYPQYFAKNEPLCTTFRYLGREVDPVRSTRRPYKDTRTEEEKQLYADALYKRQIRELKESMNETNQKEFWLLHYKAPDLCPKSRNAYSKMKLENGEAFRHIYEEAKCRGIPISPPPNELVQQVGSSNRSEPTVSDDKLIKFALNEAKRNRNLPYALALLDSTRRFDGSYAGKQILYQIIVLLFEFPESNIELFAVAYAHAQLPTTHRQVALQLFEQFIAQASATDHKRIDQYELYYTMQKLCEEERRFEEAIRYAKLAQKTGGIHLLPRLIQDVGDLLAKIDIDRCVRYYDNLRQSPHDKQYDRIIEDGLRIAKEKQERGYVYRPRAKKPPSPEELANDAARIEQARRFL